MQIHFDITGDNSNIVSVVNDTTKKMEELSGYMKSLSDKGLDLSSAEMSITSLRHYIEGLKGTMDAYKETIEQLSEKQTAALAIGDVKGAEKYGQTMRQLADDMKEIELEGQKAFKALSAIDKTAKGIDPQRMKELELVTKAFGKEAEEAGNRVDGMGQIINGLKGKIATAFSIAGVTSFLKKVYDTRSYFQDIESSMEVFLGSQEKANKFTKDLKDYAYYNMFEFSDLARASQQLIAYGNDVEKISGKGGILDQLSNIATATKVPLLDLVNAWNKAKNVGTVDSQGMASWAAKGLVLTDVLKDMGEKVEGNRVSFEQLQRAIAHVTEEGQMFGGLMEKMMPNLSSSWGQLQDNIASMFNEIGEAIQEPMHDAIDWVSGLVENYQKIGKEIGALVAAYGTYRAALLVCNAVEAVSIKIKAAHVIASEAQALGLKKVTAATVLANKAQKLFNKAIMANPYVIAAAAIAGLTYGLIKLGQYLKDDSRLSDEFGDYQEKLKERLDESTSAAEEYIKIIQDKTASELEQANAYEELGKLSPKLVEAYTQEELAAASLTEVLYLLNRARDEEEESSLEAKYNEYHEALKLDNERLEKIESGEVKVGKLQKKLLEKRVAEEKKAANDAYAAWRKKSDENWDKYIEPKSGTSDTGPKKEPTDAELKAIQRRADAIRSAEEARQKQEEELAEKGVEITRDAEKRKIEAMEDGFDKEMAMLDFEHQGRLDAIEKNAMDETDKVVKLQKDRYKAEHGTLNGFQVDTEDPMLHTISEQAFLKAEAENNQYFDSLINIIDKDQEELNEKYREYWEDFSNIETEIAARMAEANAAGVSDGVLNRLLSESFDDLTSAAEKWAQNDKASGFSKWLEDLAGKSFVDLQVILDELEGQLEYLGHLLPDDEVAKLKAQILIVKKAIDDGNFADETGEMAQNATEATTSWADLNQVLNDTAALFQQVGDAIGGPFGEAIKLVGNFTTQVAQMGNAVNAFENAANAAEKFSAGLSFAGAALSIATSIAGKIKEANEQTEKVNLATQAYYRTLKTIQDSKVLESFSNAFGTDTLGQFRVNIDIASDAKANIDKTIATYKEGLSKMPKMFQDAFSNILSSDQRTGLQKLLGSNKNITSKALSDFFDAEGNLLGEELKQWYDTYGEGLASAQKKLVEDLIGEYDRLKDATDNIASYLSDVFGDVAQDMATDMVDSFIESGSAIQDMTKYMNDFAKSMAVAVVKRQLLDNIFTDTAQKEIAGLIAKGDNESIVKATQMWNQLIQTANAQVPNIESFLSQIDFQESTESGSDRTASSRSSLGASQDSIDESNGRLTAIQDYVFQMIGTVSAFKESNDRLITTAALVLEHTQGIHLDTSELRLIQSDMREVSRQINRNVSQIVEKGVVMR